MNMVEVLIAWTLVATVLLGMLRAQNQLMRDSSNDFLRVVAWQQLANMAERLQASQDPAFRQHALSRWNIVNRKVLPDGLGHYHCGQARCEIHLKWGRGEHATLYTAG